MSSLHIRPAVIGDIPVILSFIRQLAEYEKMSDAVVADEAGLRESIFSAASVTEVLLGFENDLPVAFAVFFHNFSTFLGRPGLYLEDLFVLPDRRGHGVGTAMLVRLAQLAVERGCGRFEWSVLDWNEPAIQFYRKLGATSLDEWTTFRVTGDALKRLAES